MRFAQRSDDTIDGVDRNDRFEPNFLHTLQLPRISDGRIGSFFAKERPRAAGLEAA